ncbi:MAG: hypothetical protein WA151_08100, partial [Desulfatirhabdiaceae bacterium]
KIFIYNRVPTAFEEKRTAQSGNFLYLQWLGRKNSLINAYRAGTQVCEFIQVAQGHCRGI